MKDISATISWRLALTSIKTGGALVKPRGLDTLEVPHRFDKVRMSSPVVLSKRRALSYRFAAAEAYWILSGSNRLDELAPWNSNMAKYSDDGETLFGAYGPPIKEQLDFVVGRLLLDKDTRQAALTIWRPNPPPSTKDTPCTVAMVFSRRNNQLNAHVFMRSNDVWMGWPYDVFSFSMVAHLICCRLNAHRRAPNVEPAVRPGTLYLTAASSHLYKEHWTGADECIAEPSYAAEPVPHALSESESTLMATLRELRDTSPGHALRWWEKKDQP